MTKPGYRKKLDEVQYHLKKMQEAFEAKDPDLVHSLNAFLSAAQSVIWVLNKAFNKKDGYSTWEKSRPERLPAEGRVFKELRNVSIKEGPVENKSVIIGFRLGEGTNEPALGPHETFTSPSIDTQTGELLGKPTVTSADGKTTREVDAMVLYDFGVAVESKGKVYSLPAVIKAGEAYLDALTREVDETQQRFG